jgi:hypothetical protein
MIRKGEEISLRAALREANQKEHIQFLGGQGQDSREAGSLECADVAEQPELDNLPDWT